MGSGCVASWLQAALKHWGRGGVDDIVEWTEIRCACDGAGQDK